MSQLIFKNEYVCKLDDRFRLKLPIELKRALPVECNMKLALYRRMGSKEILHLKPIHLWDKEIELIMQNMNQFSPAHSRFMDTVMSGFKEVDVDSADRIQIPASVADIFANDKEVIVRGQGDYIVLQSKKMRDDALDTNAMTEEEIELLSAILLKKQ